MKSNLMLKFQTFLAYLIFYESRPMLFNKRLAAVLLLGFSSGLPLALIGSTLQAWFTEAGVNLVSIGALSLLGLPFAFKFLWAPLMDHYSFYI